MLFSALATLASLAGAALAAPAALDRSVASAVAKRHAYDERTIHTVAVGRDGLRYTPEFVYARKGDVVLFEFFPSTHTVSESSFDRPCDALADPSGLATGLASKYSFATDKSDGKQQPVFAFSVQDDEHPIWFYSGQDEPVNECAAGMVFAVNPPAEGNTFAKFLAKAKATGEEKDKHLKRWFSRKYAVKGGEPDGEDGSRA